MLQFVCIFWFHKSHQNLRLFFQTSLRNETKQNGAISSIDFQELCDNREETYINTRTGGKTCKLSNNVFCLFSFPVRESEARPAVEGLSVLGRFDLCQCADEPLRSCTLSKAYQESYSGRGCSSYLTIITWSSVHPGILWRRDVNQEGHHIQTAFSPQKLKALDTYASGKQRGFKLFFEEGFWNVFAARVLKVWRHAKWSSSDEMPLCPEDILPIPPSTRSPRR